VDDAERQALLEADGERVLRVTWDQVIARPGQTLVRIRAAGAPIHQQNSNMLRTKPIVPGASAR
jgi:very-short-patch-repair endonuclease